MRRKLPRILVVLFLSAVLLIPSVGCNKALGLQDWQRDALTFVGAIAGGYWAVQMCTVTERVCYQDGQLIDCALVPVVPAN
ncbi:MAG: hypothetical protein ABIG44_08470 [Planctomycetota bacterium]